MGEPTKAQLAASWAEQMLALPAYAPLLRQLDLQRKRSYDPQRPPYEIVRECESFEDRQNIAHLISEILSELATKGPISISERPTDDSDHEEWAVAKHGDLALTFHSRYGFIELRQRLSIICCYNPVLVQYL